MQIIPAILKTTYKDIENQVSSVFNAKRIHIDINEKTWPYINNKNDINADYQINALLNEEKGLPSWENHDFEFDILYKIRINDFETLSRLGADTIFIHTEYYDEEDIIKIYNILQDYFIDFGIAFTYDEYKRFINMPYAKDIIKKAHKIQLMTISQVGSQGMPYDMSFENDAINILNNIRQTNSDIRIQIDGGLDENSMLFWKDMGVDAVIMGSAIFKNGNPGENLKYFEGLE